MNLFNKKDSGGKDVGDVFKAGFSKFMKGVKTLASGELDAGSMGIVYITRNLIGMPFPSAEGGIMGIPVENMASYFKSKHPGRYMVWNLSDKKYDYSYFDDQVIEFSFPGYPSPPLDKVFTICRSLDGWIRADPMYNVAVVHCQTGRGRTIIAIACYLAWTNKFSSAIVAAKHYATLLGETLSQVLIPTQIRYIGYIDQLLSEQYPHTKPMVLQRVNTVPAFNSPKFKSGCRPYLQIFKNAKLQYSSYKDTEETIRSYQTIDDSMIFHVNQQVQGDILIRFRHLGKSSRVTMFRFGFHTGFIEEGVLQLNRKQVDGADSQRFSKDFNVGLVFGNVLDVDDESKEQSVSLWEALMHRDELTPEEVSMINSGDDSLADLENYMDDLEEDNLGEYEIGDDEFLDQLQKELASGSDSNNEDGILMDDQGEDVEFDIDNLSE